MGKNTLKKPALNRTEYGKWKADGWSCSAEQDAVMICIPVRMNWKNWQEKKKMAELSAEKEGKEDCFSGTWRRSV